MAVTGTPQKAAKQINEGDKCDLNLRTFPIYFNFSNVITIRYNCDVKTSHVKEEVLWQK